MLSVKAIAGRELRLDTLSIFIYKNAKHNRVLYDSKKQLQRMKTIQFKC